MVTLFLHLCLSQYLCLSILPPSCPELTLCGGWDVKIKEITIGSHSLSLIHTLFLYATLFCLSVSTYNGKLTNCTHQHYDKG